MKHNRKRIVVGLLLFLALLISIGLGLSTLNTNKIDLIRNVYFRYAYPENYFRLPYLGPAYMNKDFESFYLNNGQKVYGVSCRKNQAKKASSEYECSSCVFKDKRGFFPLDDGRYLINEGITTIPIMVESACMFTYSGKAKLVDGETVEFYKTDRWELARGERVYLKKDGHYTPVENAVMQLENGDTFKVNDWIVTSEDTCCEGVFMDGHIVYPVP